MLNFDHYAKKTSKIRGYIEIAKEDLAKETRDQIAKENFGVSGLN